MISIVLSLHFNPIKLYLSNLSFKSLTFTTKLDRLSYTILNIPHGKYPFSHSTFLPELDAFISIFLPILNNFLFKLSILLLLYLLSSELKNMLL